MVKEESVMKSFDTDVVVIAGGAAGLAAAISAAENGASVIILEKAATTGGAGNMGMGPLAVGSKLQRQRMVSLTKEEAFKKFMDYTHWRVDAALVKAYLNKSAETIEWLEEMGVEFYEPAKNFPSSEATWHIVKPATGKPGPRSASYMYKIMTERAQELEIDILLETPARKILKENGRITGVIAEDKFGEAIQVNARAVIVATGGFGDNPEMIKEYLGYEWGRDLFSFKVPGVTGDGIKMAWEVGAGNTEMNMEIIIGVPGLQGTAMTDYAFRQPKSLLVNQLGDRFINEQIMENTTFAGNAINRQPNRYAYSIIDKSILKYYQKNGFDLVSNVFPDIDLSDFESNLQKLIDEGNPNVFIADDLEDLANMIGIDSEHLTESVDDYNRGCSEKEDYFDKNKTFLKPIKGPKFYAARFFVGAYGSLGGIKINSKTEVITKEWMVIPGLYAAGTDACTIFGDSYCFVLPGNTMGFALNSGRIAGENAAEYINAYCKS